MYATTVAILLLTCAADIALLALLLREKPSQLRIVFLIYVVGITGWSLAILSNLWLQSAFVEYFIFAFAAIFLTAQFWFAKLFPDIPLPKSPFAYWSVLIGLFFMLASFYPGAVFSSLQFHPTGYTIVENGFLSNYYSLFALAYVCAPVIMLARTYRRTEARLRRIQLRYLLIGFSLFLGINILTNSILPVFFRIFIFNAIGPVFSVTLAGAVFYIIWRYQFLDIRLVIQRGLIYSILLASLVAVYFGLLFGIAEVERLRTLIDAPIAGLIVMVLGVATVPTLETYFRKKTDPWFFKDRYDYSEALQELTDILNTNSLPRPLVEKTEQALGRILRAQFVRFAATDSAGDPGAAMRIPISARRQTFGVLLIGSKRSGDHYVPQDERLLATFASAFAIALQKAQLLSQVRQHSRELEKKVADRTRHLEELQDYQRRMTSDISHALQTPLTVLQGSIERLLHTKAVPHKTASVARESVGKLSQSLYDLLRLSKLEALPSEEHAEFSLSETVSEITEYVRTVCAQRNIALETDIEPNIAIRGDQRQIEELLNNLLSNAIKYIGAGNEKRIAVSLRKNRGRIELSVANTGIGIPAAALPFIFDRFYRAPSNVADGSGLGLAICKRIAELHGGEIAVQSAENKGTIFVVRLPIAKISEKMS